MGKNFFYSLRLHSCWRANLNLAPITFFLLIKLCKSSTKKRGLWGCGKNENKPKKRILPPANYLCEDYTIWRHNRIFIKLTILCVSGVSINDKYDKKKGRLKILKPLNFQLLNGLNRIFLSNKYL